MNRTILMAVAMSGACAALGCGSSSTTATSGDGGPAGVVVTPPPSSPPPVSGSTGSTTDLTTPPDNPNAPASAANDPAPNPNAPAFSGTAASGSSTPVIIPQNGGDHGGGMGGAQGGPPQSRSCGDLCSTLDATCTANCTAYCGIFDSAPAGCSGAIQALLSCINRTGLVCVNGVPQAPNGQCSSEGQNAITCAQGTSTPIGVGGSGP